MQKHELPKPIKKALRSLIDLAYEAELRDALDHLHEDFQQWKCGEIDSFDLSDRIHKFHDGPSRDLFGLYSSRLDPRFLVERAVEKGLVPKEFVPVEVRSYIKDISDFGRELPEG